MMMGVTANEMLVLLKIFKTPEQFNANSISREIGLTPMGALKILKRLEKEGIVVPKAAGRAVFYGINYGSDYSRDYMEFVLRREAEQSTPYIKRWVREIRKLKSADAAVLFGSVLEKEGRAKDIDVLLVTSQERFKKLKDEISGLNNINEKSIHPVYQTSEDLRNNIAKKDKVVLNALKGIVVFGGKKMIEMIG